ARRLGQLHRLALVLGHRVLVELRVGLLDARGLLVLGRAGALGEVARRVARVERVRGAGALGVWRGPGLDVGARRLGLLAVGIAGLGALRLVGGARVGVAEAEPPWAGEHERVGWAQREDARQARLAEAVERVEADVLGAAALGVRQAAGADDVLGLGTGELRLVVAPIARAARIAQPAGEAAHSGVERRATEPA